MWCRRVALVGLGVAAAVLGPVLPAVAATIYSLQPGFSVRETYDDNVFRVNENRRDDFITTVGAGLTLATRSPRFATSADYRLGVDFFAKATQEQGQLSHSGSLSMSYQATRRLTLHLGDGVSFVRTTEPDAALAVPSPLPAAGSGPASTAPPQPVEPGSIPTRRVRRLNNAVQGGFSYQYDARTSLSGAYLFRVTDFDAPDLVDTQIHRVSFRAARQVARDDRVGAAYTFSWIRFQEPVLDDRQVHQVLATWRHDFSPEISAELGAGVTWTDRGDVDLGLAGDASLTKQVGLTRYSLTYSGSLSATGGTGEVQRTDGVALGVARPFSARLTGQAGIAYARTEPLQDSPGATNTYSATAGFGGTLTRWLRGALAYSFERKDAPSSGNSFRNHRVTVGLTLLFPALKTTSF